MTDRLQKFFECTSFISLNPSIMLILATYKRYRGLSASLRLARKTQGLILQHTPFRSFCSSKGEIEFLGRFLLRYVPKASCLELACATSLWLAVFSQNTRLVVSRSGGVELGYHAWLEWGDEKLFIESASEYALFSWELLDGVE